MEPHEPSEQYESQRVTSKHIFSRSLSRAAQEGSPPEGTWWTLALLNISGTLQPPYLALPYAMAQLGWVGGILTVVLSGAAALFTTLLLALLHHHGGKRHIRYKDMSREIIHLPKINVEVVVSVLQLTCSFGVAVAAFILNAQLLGSIWQLFCSPDACGDMNNSRWTAVVGAVSLLVAQIPDLGALDFAVLFGGIFTVTYSVIAIVLSFTHAPATVSYALQGSTAGKTFNFLNALGIVIFCYANSLVPEMQSTLALVPPENTSVRPMVKGTLASFVVICGLYIVVSIVGYYNFGAAAPGFLLQAFSTPSWLVAMANAMCSFQMFSAAYIYAFPLYENTEAALLKRMGPARGWARHVRRDDQGQKWVSSSLALRLLVRTPFILLFTFVAAALPFFTSILGFLGALGFTPLTYVLPAYLFLTARTVKLARWQRVGLWAFMIFTSLLGTAAAVGSMRSIIVSASTFDYFS